MVYKTHYRTIAFLNNTIYYAIWLKQELPHIHFHSRLLYVLVWFYFDRNGFVGNESCLDNDWGKLLSPHANTVLEILSHTAARANSHYTLEEYVKAVSPALR